MTPREVFLQRVREAVVEGNRAGTGTPLPPGEGQGVRVGYQGGGPDPVARFCQELAAAGGKGYVAADAMAVVHTIQSILQTHNARKILLSRGGLIDRLEMPMKLRSLGMDVKSVDEIMPPLSPYGRGAGGEGRDDFFAADVGITNVHRLIAETGTVVLASKANEPRSVSLLPPVHICLAERSQLLPDLFDLFDLFAPTASPTQSLPPSCLSLITGPSKTGDIELRLVTGVHGPGEVHVILCPN